MLGPDVAGYLIVAAFLFATGALGVLIRRSPLIVLLSLEIMLNGANLALIAFSRHFGRADGQIFALAVMAVAASEVVVGLGLIVAMARRKLDLDVDKLSTPARMTTAAWICLFLPLGSAVADHRARDEHLSGGRPAGSPMLASAGAFAAAVVSFAAMLGAGRPAIAVERLDRLDVARDRELPRRPLDPHRPALGDDDADRQPESDR